MVEHIILFKPKPTAMKEHIQTCTQTFLKMADEILVRIV